jgi:hypothetical protein
METEYRIKLNVIFGEEKEEEKIVEINLEKIEKFQDLVSKLVKETKVNRKISKCILEILYYDNYIRLIDLKEFYFFISNNMQLEIPTKIKLTENKKYDTVFDNDGNIYTDDQVNL